MYATYLLVAFGGLEVACLPFDPRSTGSNPDENDGFLRAIKIRSATSFTREVKSSVPSRKIYGMLKEPYEYERYI
jgi:hypothetical protein